MSDNGLLGYVIRRLLWGLATLLLASLLVFVVIQLPPGDYATYYAARMAMGGDAEVVQVEDLRAMLGLDQSAPVRYLRWVTGFLRGDMGYSLMMRQPVATVVMQDLGMTVLLGGLILLFTWILAIPAGVYTALHQYSPGDYLVSILCFLGFSVPNFFLGLVMLYILVAAFHVSSVGGLFSSDFVAAPWSWARFVDFCKHVWLPVLVAGTAEMATVARVMRANMLDVLPKKYVTTARAKGLAERVVVFRHALRVAINPLVSLAGMQLPRLLSGVVVTAIVLNLPVMGPTFLSAVKAQDMELAGAYLMMMVGLMVMGNLLADVVLAWIDPRIRYQ